jgi:hypothetical protein
MDRCGAARPGRAGRLRGGRADAFIDEGSSLAHAHGCPYRGAQRYEYADTHADSQAHRRTDRRADPTNAHADTADGDATTGNAYRVRCRV